MVIPPDFIAEDTSSDVIVPEGSSVKLTCRFVWLLSPFTYSNECVEEDEKKNVVSTHFSSHICDLVANDFFLSSHFKFSANKLYIFVAGHEDIHIQM